MRIISMRFNGLFSAGSMGYTVYQHGKERTFSLVFLDTVVCFVMIPWGWFIGIPFMYNSLVWFTMGFKYMHT